jgi:hypothetical protein
MKQMGVLVLVARQHLVVLGVSGRAAGAGQQSRMLPGVSSWLTLACASCS